VLEHNVFKGYAYNASFDREALVGMNMDYLANGLQWYDMLQAVRVRWDISRKNLFRDQQVTWSRNGKQKSSNLGDIVERLTEIRAIEARPDHSALADTRALFGLWQDFKSCHKRTDFSI
jgi:mRNA-degrading endonuclease YafQ of YafQ-DinJ toxin-antitoxin module